MRIPGRVVKGLAAVLAAVVVLVLVVRAWVVPALIVGRIEAVTGGKTAIRGWWLNGRSAGVTGLTVRDGPATDAPVWAEAATVSTDLTLGGLLRGRFAPKRVHLEGAKAVVRIGRDGELLTKAGPRSSKTAASGLPVVIADAATVTVRQEGRPEMVVDGVTARLGPSGDRVSLAVRSNRPEWGPFEALGLFDADFRTGRIDLKTLRGVEATPEKARAIPFVPPEVWDHVAPRGEVGLRLSAVVDRAKSPPVTVRVEVDLRGTTVTSETLDLTASRTTGRVVVDGAVVRLENVAGTAIDGRVKADGTLDFNPSPPRCDVSLDLAHLDVADTPKSWQLDETGLTGHLTGKVRLLARLDPKGVDLSGSTGDAVVEAGEIQGIKFKTLRLQMKAEGNDLRYDTGNVKASSSEAGRRFRVWLSSVLVALQGAASPDKPAPPEPRKDKPPRPVIQLPKSISTHLELEDVDLGQLIARAELFLGFPFPLPISGRLSLNADATIPLGQLRSLKDYAFHGDLTLARASVYGVDLGRVSSRIDLADGVLDLKDLRGRLVDRPDGGPDNPPTPSEAEVAVPATGPLPPGGFRGSLHAAVAPAGRLTARFEGVDLPIGELGAPALPRPTPLSGLATLTVDASADLSAARDPAAWTVSGTAQSRQIRYREAALDAVAFGFGLKNGRLDVPELTARLRDRPLSARVGIDVKSPHAFRGALDVSGWDLAQIIAWIPDAPKPAPVAGAVNARAEASGTLQPRSVRTEGRGRIDAFQAGPVALGVVPFEWTTKGETIALTVTDARPFGGRLTAAANLPLTPGRAIDGSATVEAIDAARLAAAIPGAGLQLTGHAGGTVKFTIPSDVSTLSADATFSAPDLTVQGLPAERARATVKAHRGAVDYEITAESLGGKFSLKGAIPFAENGPPDPRLAATGALAVSNGELRMVGFGLEPLWRGFAINGPVARLSGRGAIDANVRAILGGREAGLYTHGVVEVRDLKWGPKSPLGWLRGVVASTPAFWRFDKIEGDLLGGAASGALWSADPAADGGAANDPRRVGFDLRLDRVPLRNVAAFLPAQTPAIEGLAAVRLSGTLGDSGRAAADVQVARAQVAGLPLSDLRAPTELVTNAGGSGVLQVRRASARLAGGQVRGDASLRVGSDRSFQVDLTLGGVDLETVARVASEARRPASGRINGRVTLNGPDPSLPERYRGTVALDLDDASLVSLPVFRELDRFLGSARGGLFEDGDLTGTIANRQLQVDKLTLEGRIAQLHATGSVGFDGQLNLEVLVNTNQIIPQTGQALVNVIPGLRDVIGRNREATLRVANFLSNRLLKFRVTGTVRNPSVAADPAVVVADTAVGFFAGVLKLPLGLAK